MRILLILIFLCSTANAALTPNKLPKTKTGGTAPTLQDSTITDDGTNVTTTGNITSAAHVVSGYGSSPQITNALDTNTGMFFSGPDVIDFHTGGSHGLVINSAQNVGVATNSPLARLHVEQPDAVDAFRVNDQSSDTTPFVINSAGNVGIGSAAPGATVDIVTSGSNTMLRLINGFGNATLVTNSASLQTGFFNGGSEAAPIISFNGDLDTGMYRSAANTMRIVTGGASRITFDSAGNVGIATFEPNAILDISSTAAQDLFRVNDNGTGDTTPFIITSAGNVGIGTVVTTDRLFTVDSSGSGTGNRFSISGGAGSSNRDLNFQPFATGAAGQGGWNIQTLINNNQNGSGTTLALQNLAGNVGIATFHANALLDISSTAAQDLFRVNDNGTGDTSPFIIDSTGNVGIGTIIPVAELEVTQTAAQDAFRVNDQANDITPFVINSDGNIGIGTSLPVSKFEITGATTPTTGLKISSSVANNPRFDLFNDGTFGYIRANTDAGSNYNLSFDGNIIRFQQYTTGWTERMRIANGGNIGISTDAPNALLDISSTAAQDLFRVNDNGTGDTTPFLINSVGNVGIGSVTPSSILDIDIGTGVGQVTINGSTGGCLMIRDTDDAGWTECDVLDGVMTCSIDADGICD